MLTPMPTYPFLVTEEAQQSSHLAGMMVVIHVQCLVRLLVTDPTPPVIASVHRLKRRLSNAVLRP